jgi:hypothetical protein
MENIPNAATSNTSNILEVPKQKTRRRIGKLSEADLAAFPGADMTPVKMVDPAYKYYIVFNIPATGTFGTPTEASQVHDYAYQLDTQAKAKAVGSVTSVGVANGSFDVELKLDVAGEQEKHSAPAAGAIAKLQDFLGNAAQLKKGPAGKLATYKAKVNGTTIVEGHF